MIRIAVCDNDFFYRKDVERICVEYYGNGCAVVLFDDGEDFIAALEGNTFDIVFLDTEMRRRNGIEVKQYLEDNKINSAIIFIAGNAAHIREAFGKNVYGYMEKPVQREDLFSLLERVNALSDCSRTLTVKDIHGRYKAVETADIYYISGELNYTRIHFAAGESVLVYSTLKKWMEILEHTHFVRIHKSYIVNLEHVDRIGRQVHISDYALPVPQNRLKQVRQMYAAYISRHVSR